MMKPTPPITRPISIGLIGYGKQGSQHFESLLPLIKQHRIQICGICDLLQPGTFQNIPFFQDYRDLLAEQKPDAVIITTPNYLHQEIGMAALSAGCDIIKEKPLATSYAEGKELTQRAETLDRLVITAQQRFYSPFFQKVKQLIPELGEILDFSYHFTVNDETNSWYWELAKAGGGSWLNMGWHGITILQWLLGPVTDVQLTWNTGGKRNWVYDTDHSSFARLTINQNTTGHVFFSCIYPKEESLKIVGNNGTILLTREKLKFITSTKVRVYRSFQPTTTAYVRQYQRIFQQLGTREHRMQADLQTLAVISQGIESLNKGGFHAKKN